MDSERNLLFTSTLPVGMADDVYHNIVYQTLMFEGFLSEFSDDQVRNAFLEGSLGVPENTRQMLGTLDVLRSMLLPRLLSADSDEGRSDRALAGVIFFVSLLGRSRDFPVDHRGRGFPVSKTFNQWYIYFEKFSGLSRWRSNVDFAPVEQNPVDPVKSTSNGTVDSFSDSFSVDNGQYKLVATEPPSFDLGGGQSDEQSQTKEICGTKGKSADIAQRATVAVDAEHGVASDNHREDVVPSVRPKIITTKPFGAMGKASVDWSRRFLTAHHHIENDMTRGQGSRYDADRNRRSIYPEHGGSLKSFDPPNYLGRGDYFEQNIQPKLRSSHEMNDKWSGRPSRKVIPPRNVDSYPNKYTPSERMDAEWPVKRSNAKQGNHFGISSKSRDSSRAGSLREHVKPESEVGSGASSQFREFDRDSTESSSTDSSLNSELEALTLGNRGSSDRNLLRALSSLQQPKDAVPPGNYDVLDGTSLNRFLGDFEMYFDNKYKGSDRQKGKHLGTFLTGSIKQAYDAIGGSRIRFSVIRPQLLTWYRNEKPSRHQKYETEFSDARIMENESLSIFAMRLERLAIHVFRDIKERERQLCRKYWKEVPKSFSRIMADNERSMSLVSGMKKLSWGHIKKLAEAEGRQRKRQPTMVKEEQVDRDIWFSRPADAPPSPSVFVEPGKVNPSHGDKEKKVRFPDQVFRNKSTCQLPGARGRASNLNQDRPKPFVSHSGEHRPGRSVNPGSRNGNNVKNDGRWSESWSDGPSRRNFSGSERSPVSPNSRFGGSAPVCDWCGKTGHREDSCWRKQGVCFSCGSPSHSSSDCTKYNSGRTNYTPTCSRCNGDHFGQFCTSFQTGNY